MQSASAAVCADAAFSMNKRHAVRHKAANPADPVYIANLIYDKRRLMCDLRVFTVFIKRKKTCVN
jgi:hypothetical protein